MQNTLNGKNDFIKYSLDDFGIINSSEPQVGNIFHNLLKNSNKINLVITFNLDFYFNTKKNPEFYDICSKSDHIFPDGYGITKLLNLKYGISVNRITGNDIFIILLKLANKLRLRIACVGSTDSSLSMLKNKIIKIYPDINICETISPPAMFENNDAYNKQVLNRLVNSKPDILFLALGSPRQEIWLAKYKDEIGARINIGVGAAFDYYSGIKQRCPGILQKSGMEWAWRLSNEPLRLFKRYVVDDIPFFVKEYYKIKFSK